jgi:diguanylate cyclase (GGDEF)-like protein
MLDIDQFLHVNTDFGHKVGDDVLKEIAEVLLSIEIEPAPLVYRYSGDQFAVIFPEIEKERVFLLMDKIREKISTVSECARTATTVSVGIATYPEDGIRQADIIRKADDALYRAKVSGRNKVALAKEEKLVTKTAHYTVEQLKRLKDLSESTSIGEAALMREALDELLKKYDAQKKLRKTVLIVDDSELMRMMLKDIVTKAEYTVVGQCNNGNDAIAPFKASNPDFILLNLDMPGLDGIGLLKRITLQERNKVIMISAKSQPKWIAESVKYGAGYFIAKPFDAKHLLDAMNGINEYGLTPRHYDALMEELEPYMNKPDSGKEPLTQEIIDTCIHNCVR